MNTRYCKASIIAILLIVNLIVCFGIGQYVIAESADDQYTTDKQYFDLIDSMNPKRQNQIARYDSSFSTRKTGLCNVSAMVTLLNRKVIYDNLNFSFTPTDVLKANGCTSIKSSGDKYYYSGDTGLWGYKKYTLNGASFQAGTISGSAVKSATTKENFNKYIASLLHTHPEGIAIRNTKANHVAVIDRYSYINGKYQLYVKDPVNNYSGVLEKSYIWSKSGNDLYTNIDFIVFIKSSTATSHIEPMPAPERIELDCVNTSLNLIDTLQLNATCYPDNSNTSLKWTSSSPNVATVSSSGLVTPMNLGTTVITAQSVADESLQASCEITTYYNGSGTLQYNGITYPGIYNYNDNGFNWYSSDGTITSDVNINEVTFTLYDNNGKVISTKTDNPNKKSVSMATYNLDIKLSQLKTSGSSYLEIIAKDAVGRKLNSSICFGAYSGGTTTRLKLNRTYKKPELVAVNDGSHQYELYSSSYTWEDARDYAELNGGYLACIGSSEENYEIQTLLQQVNAERAWIGGYYNGSGYSWVNDENLGYTHWASGEPSKSGLNNYCIYIRTNGYWADTRTNEILENQYFVVEYDTEITDFMIAEYKDGWNNQEIGQYQAYQAIYMPNEIPARIESCEVDSTIVEIVGIGEDGVIILKNKSVGTATLTVRSDKGYTANIPISVISNITSVGFTLYYTPDDITYTIDPKYVIDDEWCFIVDDFSGFNITAQWFWNAAPDEYAWHLRLPEGSKLAYGFENDGQLNNNGNFRVNSNGENYTGMPFGEYIYFDLYENGELVPDACRKIWIVVEPYPLGHAEFTVPSSVSFVEEEAFSGIAAYSVDLGSAEYIGSRAFADCPNLKKVYIPRTMYFIADDAFEGTTELTLYGVNDHYAEQYAKEHGFKYVPIFW